MLLVLHGQYSPPPNVIFLVFHDDALLGSLRFRLRFCFRFRCDMDCSPRTPYLSARERDASGQASRRRRLLLWLSSGQLLLLAPPSSGSVPVVLLLLQFLMLSAGFWVRSC